MKTSIAAALSAALTAGCSTVPAPNIAAAPQALQPAGPQAHVRVVPAAGVQIYECRVRKDGTGHEWAFVAPEAKLYGPFGRVIGDHGAGPYWQARDGSRIEGSVVARSDAPNGAIPWLLLATKSAGPAGSFSAVTSVQRVNTDGGVAPAGGCAAGTVGQSARVPYTADYVLFSAR